LAALTRRVEVQERGADDWVVRDVVGSGGVALGDLGLGLSLDEIYG
jgi:hypothetical protein